MKKYLIIPALFLTAVLTGGIIAAGVVFAQTSGAAIQSGETSFVEVNGVELAYQEAGEGTPMVLIHGYPLSSGLFARNIDELASEYHVYAVTLRGYGQSGTPGDASSATIDAYSSDVLAFMDELGIEEAVIGGMSMGGPIAFDMYEKAPERFEGLILIDTIAAPANAAEAGLWQGTAEFVEGQGVGALPGLVMDEMLTGEARAEESELVSYLSGIMEGTSLEAAISGANALANRPDFRPLLSSIDVPTLIIVGRGDTIYPFEVSERMQQAIDGSELVIIEGASHAAVIEEADAVNQAILEWGDGTDGSAGGEGNGNSNDSDNDNNSNSDDGNSENTEESNEDENNSSTSEEENDNSESNSQTGSYITGEDAFITLSSYFFTPNGSFTVRGGEFVPDEEVQVSVLGETKTVQADANGRFETDSFNVGFDSVDSDVEVRAEGLSSGAIATATLTAGTYHPVVETSGYYVEPGDQVTLSGRGFASGETVTIYVNGTQSAQVAADSTGSFSQSFTAPSSEGSHQYEFVGESSGASYELTIETDLQ